jgi:carbamoyltransferase
MNMKFFNYCQGLTMTNRAFSQLFDMEPRRPESMLEQKHMDLAASVQKVTEEIVLAMARNIHHQTGLKHLVLAGGVALNCVANGKLLREGPFENIWIQPAAGDAGGALGAAQFVWYQLLDNPRQTDDRNDLQRGSLLGPRHDSDSIASFLTQNQIRFQRFENEHELVNHVAKLLADEKVIGWFQGRMEFGPRALGSRSIIGDARSPKMQAVMNLKIKYRESFRPFAPIVLREKASEWFDIATEHESPYMLLVADVVKDKQILLTPEQQATMSQSEDLRERVNISRSQIPAVTHVDYSARLQTVDDSRNPRLHHLLKQFDALTGCPVLVNTSFNVRGEPIVCTPEDAYRCFLSTDMDALVLEDCLVLKTDIAPDAKSIDREKHLKQFALD